MFEPFYMIDWNWSCLIAEGLCCILVLVAELYSTQCMCRNTACCQR